MSDLIELGKSIHWDIEAPMPLSNVINYEGLLEKYLLKIDELVKSGKHIDESDEDTGHSILTWLCIASPRNSGAEKLQIDLIDHVVKKRGADINRRCIRGFTLLMWSVIFANRRMCEKLLALGADTSISDRNGKTALELAISFSYEDIVAILSSSE